MKSISEVDRCEAELTARTQETVANLTQYCESMVEWLESKKNEMHAALAEIEATMMEERPALRTKYGQVIRDRLEMRETDVTLFAYTLPELQFDTLALLNVEDQSDSVKYMKVFPSIVGNTLNLFDIASKQCSTYTLDMKFTPGTTFCFVDTNTLLCVGAHPGSVSVFSLDLLTKTVAQLPDMKHPRAFASLVKVGCYVYVFGGNYPDPQPCEKYSLIRQTWNTCPVHLNEGYVACAVQLQDIYLISHKDTLTVKVFDTRVETIRTLVSTNPEVIPDFATSIWYPQVQFEGLQLDTQRSLQLPLPLRRPSKPPQGPPIMGPLPKFGPLGKYGPPAKFGMKPGAAEPSLASPISIRGPTWAFIVEHELFLLSCIDDIFLLHWKLDAQPIIIPQFQPIAHEGLPLQSCPAFVKDKECILSDTAGNMVALNTETGATTITKSS